MFTVDCSTVVFYRVDDERRAVLRHLRTTAALL